MYSCYSKFSAGKDCVLKFFWYKFPVLLLIPWLQLTLDSAFQLEDTFLWAFIEILLSHHTGCTSLNSYSGFSGSYIFWCAPWPPHTHVFHIKNHNQTPMEGLGPFPTNTCSLSNSLLLLTLTVSQEQPQENAAVVVLYKHTAFPLNAGQIQTDECDISSNIMYFTDKFKWVYLIIQMLYNDTMTK